MCVGGWGVKFFSLDLFNVDLSPERFCPDITLPTPTLCGRGSFPIFLSEKGKGKMGGEGWGGGVGGEEERRGGRLFIYFLFYFFISPQVDLHNADLFPADRFRPDITAMTDWASKTNYLSIGRGTSGKRDSRRYVGGEWGGGGGGAGGEGGKVGVIRMISALR